LAPASRVMCVVELSRRSSIDAGRKTGSILSRACLLSLPLSYAVMASKTFQEAVAVEPRRVPLLLLKFFCFYLSGQQDVACKRAACSLHAPPTALCTEAGGNTSENRCGIGLYQMCVQRQATSCAGFCRITLGYPVQCCSGAATRMICRVVEKRFIFPARFPLCSRALPRCFPPPLGIVLVM